MKKRDPTSGGFYAVYYHDGSMTNRLLEVENQVRRVPTIHFFLKHLTSSTKMFLTRSTSSPARSERAAAVAEAEAEAAVQCRVRRGWG